MSLTLVTPYGSFGSTPAQCFNRAAEEQHEATERALTEHQTPKMALELFADIQARLIKGVSESPFALRRGCQAKCSACCCVPRVDVTALEALAVAEHLRCRCRGAALSAARTRLAERVARRHRLLPEARRVTTMPCALLTAEGRCAVYASRPLACAGIFSLSSSACAAAAQQSGSNNARIPLDRPAKVWTMGTSMGLRRGLAAVGLDANLYELDSSVLKASDQPNSFERWLRGKDVFKHCICTDAYSPPRMGRRIDRVDQSHATVSPSRFLGRLRLAQQHHRRTQ